MSLTDIKIQSLKPEPKSVRHYDSGGLYLEISPAGGRWWRYKYRFLGKEKRLSLGVYPKVTLKNARQARNAARDLLSRGIEPSAARKDESYLQLQRGANHFAEVARQWFEKQRPVWAKSHSDRVIRLLERDIFPWLGKRPIAEIKPPELLSVLHRIESRGALETAHRALRICGQVFRYGVASGLLPVDSSRDLRNALRPVVESNFPAVTNPLRVGAILRMLEGYNGTPPVRSALRLAPLLFVRPGELRSAEWSDVDLEGAEWRYHVTKTSSDHIVPLSLQAVEILRELQVVTGGGRFVFPSARGKDRPMSDNALLAALRNLGINKSELTTHGWRATARTLLDEELGFRPDIIEQQLAHEVLDPNGRAYNRTAFLQQRKEMMQRWSDYLDELKGRVQS